VRASDGIGKERNNTPIRAHAQTQKQSKAQQPLQLQRCRRRQTQKPSKEQQKMRTRGAGDVHHASRKESLHPSQPPARHSFQRHSLQALAEHVH
jgi:hypothetical protein